MGQAYKIFGMAVKPHYLAIATLLGTFGGAAYFTGGGSSIDNSNKIAIDEKVNQTDVSSENIDVEKLLDNLLKDSNEEKKWVTHVQALTCQARDNT